MNPIRLILSLLGATALAVTSPAALVTLDTSSLAGGTFYVDFQLNDGNGVGDGSNSVTISAFNFGGGSATGLPSVFGGASGSLASSVTITDTDAFNEFFQSFVPGNMLQFELTLSNNYSGPVPDLFGFAILDANLFNLGTYSFGSDQFLTVELNGGAVDFATFGGVDGIPAPQVPDSGSTCLLLAVALAGLAGLRRRGVAAVRLT